MMETSTSVSTRTACPTAKALTHGPMEISTLENIRMVRLGLESPTTKMEALYLNSLKGVRTTIIREDKNVMDDTNKK